MLLESPLNAFANYMDKILRNQTIYDYYDYIEKVPSKQITQLLFSEIKYRADNQLNFLAEIYGQQGSGKSLFGEQLAIQIGSIFGVSFSISNNTSADFDELDSILHKSAWRSTFVVDEQPNEFVGHGSTSTKNSLKDFEEMARFTQKNIIYIAPSEREHASYFVFKEDQRTSVERITNPKCLNCQFKDSCLGKIHENKFVTVCGMPFWERHGYPKQFTFLLLSHRLTDNYLMPRGYVSMPVLLPDAMQEYDDIKKRNIGLIERKESLAWKNLRDEMNNFITEYKPKLILSTNKGLKVQSKNVIEAYLYDFIGTRKFTTHMIGIMVSTIQAELKQMSESYCE